MVPALTIRRRSQAVILLTVAALSAGCGESIEVNTGDCFAGGTAEAFDFTAKVACDEPHTVEVVAKASASGELAEFSRADLEVAGSRARQLYLAEVADRCEPAWSAYTGYVELADELAAGATVLPALYGDLAVEAVPADLWDNGERTLICYQVFGRPGRDGEQAITVEAPVLPDLIRKPTLVPDDVRDCAVGPTADSGEVRVPCSSQHNREYLGHLDLAEFVGVVPGLDQPFLDGFDSRTAEEPSWARLDGLCHEIFASLLGADRPDISLVSQVYTAEPDWGWAKDGAYHAACFAQTATPVTGSVIGIGDRALATG
jgi:hypothetical protein